jgi:hypothetical protein
MRPMKLAHRKQVARWSGCSVSFRPLRTCRRMRAGQQSVMSGDVVAPGSWTLAGEVVNRYFSRFASQLDTI